MSGRRGGRPWRRVREQVLRRDPVCTICGRRPSTTVDHIVPLVRGGAELDIANLRGACGPCNYRGGAAMTNARRARSAAATSVPPWVRRKAVTPLEW